LYYETRDPGLEGGEGQVEVFDLDTGESAVVVEGGFDVSESPDGRFLAFTSPTTSAGTRHLRLKDLTDQGTQPRQLGSDSEVRRGTPVISPSGALVAYGEGGGNWGGYNELWISRFPSGAEPTVVSGGRPTGARWSRDGTRLLYVRGVDGVLVQVAVSVEPEGVSLSRPEEVFGEGQSALNLGLGFELSADGESFLVVREATPAGGVSDGLILVQDWVAAFDSN